MILVVHKINTLKYTRVKVGDKGGHRPQYGRWEEEHLRETFFKHLRIDIDNFINRNMFLTECYKSLSN